jgi:hypothetical protein
MKYWYDQNGWHEGGIILRDSRIENHDNDRVIGMYFYEGKVILEEQCDNYFKAEFTPAQAIEAIQEAIDWIKGKMED